MGTDRIIYIRADGNSQIATGHLVRCLSIAQACLALHQNICFLVSGKDSADLLSGFCRDNDSLSQAVSSGLFSVKVLKTALYNDPEKELNELISLLKSSPAPRPIFLLDSYFVTEQYFTALKPLVYLAYLDDLQLFDYPADLVVNYDVIPDSALPAYRAFYQNAGKTLLGASYAPLRSQFQKRSLPIRENVRHLLAATGGSDPYHFCTALLQDVPSFSLFLQQNSITLHMVIGKLNSDRERLYRLEKELPFLQLHENVSDMASLMERCDLAVSAAGTTLYELCALGVPAVSFTMADNQLTAAKAFADAGAVPCAGDLRNDFDGVCKHIMEFVTQMSFSPAKRKTAHEAMQRLVDGNGAERIAKALICQTEP